MRFLAVVNLIRRLGGGPSIDNTLPEPPPVVGGGPIYNPPVDPGFGIPDFGVPDKPDDKPPVWPGIPDNSLPTPPGFPPVIGLWPDKPGLPIYIPVRPDNSLPDGKPSGPPGSVWPPLVDQTPPGGGGLPPSAGHLPVEGKFYVLVFVPGAPPPRWRYIRVELPQVTPLST